MEGKRERDYTYDEKKQEICQPASMNTLYFESDLKETNCKK